MHLLPEVQQTRASWYRMVGGMHCLVCECTAAAAAIWGWPWHARGALNRCTCASPCLQDFFGNTFGGFLGGNKKE